MSYNVIFKHTKLTGGNYKCRICIDYDSQADFEARHKPAPELDIVAQGISDDEALHLLYSVPPLCRYLGAVEEAFTHSDPRLIPELLKMKLYGALTAVDLDHDYLQDNVLGSDPIDKELWEHYQELTRDNTAKNMVMRSIIVLYDFDLNDLNPLSKGESFLNAIKHNCQQALTLYPLK